MSAPGAGSPLRPEVVRRVRERFLRSTDDDSDHDPVRHLAELLAQEAPLMGTTERVRRAEQLAAELVGLGPLQRLLDDPCVSDVLVNGPGRVWVERGGRLEQTGVELDRSEIDRAIERLIGPLGLRADRTQPIVDARLDDGTRVTIVMPPLAVDGPLLAVRRHPARALTLAELAGERVGELLGALVRRRCNLAVYGPTGAGKTTLLNALLSVVDPAERIVTIEDVAELRLPGDHIVRLEARPGTADGVGRAAIRDLVRSALRLRPDRLVVGEVRGAEAADMVWALSTGHRGCLATWHAGSAEDALTRLETLCALGSSGVPSAAISAQVQAAIDVLVGVDRRSDGRRGVTAVHAVGRRGALTELTCSAAPGEAGGSVELPARHRHAST